MKTTALAVLAVAGCAGVANAQAFYDVQVSSSVIDITTDSPFVEVSIFLDRNGSTDGFFNSFQGWSQFAGQLTTSDGTWFVDEAAAFGGQAQTSTNDNWLGRRPTDNTFFPPGTSGSFRYAGESYNLTDGGNTLGGGSNGNFEGITAPTALGGFNQDSSERLEVFRAILDISGAIPLHEDGNLVDAEYIVSIDYLAAATQVFIDAGFNTSRFVTGDMGGGSASITIVPTPASAALLGLGGLAATRRRR